ncbi:hypothetical protein HK102_002021, partial [Quaeritorhiza haematococci]
MRLTSIIANPIAGALLGYMAATCDALPNPKNATPATPTQKVDFWGFATSAYQIEGAWDRDGRGPSVWDTFAHAGNCIGNSNGDVAAKHYDMWEQDVDLMVNLKAQAYRFSISWSRILTNGRLDQVNEAGIAFYNKLIDRLLSKGITPYITLYHWDLPQPLQDEYGGWLDTSGKIVDDFVAYAKLCIDRFGDRVK